MFVLKSLYLLIFINVCTSKKYSNYTLFQAIPDSKQKLMFLQELGDLFNAKYWSYPGILNRPVDFIIAPEKKDDFIREALIQDLYVKTLLTDVQRAFDEQTCVKYLRHHTDSFDWKNYYRVDDIYNWLRDLQHKYPNILKLHTIGRTFEERDIFMARIVLPDAAVRSKVIIEGGIHAREWISIAFVTYFLHQILTSTNSSNEALKKVANLYEWYFVPVLNPDGYEYTHVKDRMFRKNRRDVDLNRNFDYNFGKVGVSHYRYSDIYCGPIAFSEAESVAVRELVRSKHENLEYYLAFHAYGQYIIIPFGDSNQHHGNFKEVKKMATNAANSIARRYGTMYTSGTTWDTVGYYVSGASTCWVKKTYNVPYVATFELRDQGTYGFALPSSQILPTCRETTDGLITFLMPKNCDIKHEDITFEDTAKLSRANKLLVWNSVIFIQLLVFV